MTRRNRILATVAVILLFAIFPMTTTPSSAFTSAPTRFYGASTSEPQISEGLRAVVEEQSITFDITEFSDVNEDDLIMEQCGRVNTSYTLYNPTEEEINMTITLPISGVPQGYVNNEDGIETEKYKFTVNGEVIEPTLIEGRYLYSSFGTIDSDTFIPTEYTSNEHFSTDMAVTKYTFRQKCSEYNNVIGIEADPDTFDGSCFVFDKWAGRIDRDDGSYFLYVSPHSNNSTFDLYVFGKQLTSPPEFDMYVEPSAGIIEKADGDVELIGSETMSYDEYISRNGYLDEDSRFDKKDLYHVFAREISNVIDMGGVYSTVRARYAYDLNYRYSTTYILNAFTYEFNIAPGERVTASLDAPLYPSIETKYVQNTYEYEYKPYFPNADIRSGNINVKINTPYYIVSNGEPTFTKTDGGYNLTIGTGYPTRSIFFTLCEVESPEEEKISEEGAVLFFIFILLASIIMLVKSAIEAIPYIIGSFFADIFSWISNFIGSLF